MNPVLQLLGEAAWVLSVSATLEDQRRLWTVHTLLQQQIPAWQIVLGMGNLTVRFDPVIEDAAQIEHAIEAAWQNSAQALDQPIRRHHDVPAHYGGAAGPDLLHVAEQAGLTPQQVVECHAATRYVVYCIGALPGFPYLGDMVTALNLPQHATPRPISAGSVILGAGQSGICPCATSGSWHVIGHTDLQLFNPTQTLPTLFAPGDTVRFVPLEVHA